ncbi:hypothetical protein DPEC_G00108710 [Dallia pectoralis]|uniref:Uncharacterized protein n=1 Tax=Dallia pectoralis TaxID=75939 RepID=A0ACC2GT21_DALPE|nr:hypothetical protein DPEC_G00108710 [Dallia pectoralis]
MLPGWEAAAVRLSQRGLCVLCQSGQAAALAPSRSDMALDVSQTPPRKSARRLPILSRSSDPTRPEKITKKVSSLPAQGPESKHRLQSLERARSLRWACEGERNRSGGSQQSGPEQRHTPMMVIALQSHRH